MQYLLVVGGPQMHKTKYVHVQLCYADEGVIECTLPAVTPRDLGAINGANPLCFVPCRAGANMTSLSACLLVCSNL